MTTTKTTSEDPLGLLTRYRERCRFGRQHGWASYGLVPSDPMRWALGYWKCFDCGQVEFDGVDEDEAAQWGWTPDDLAEYLRGARPAPLCTDLIGHDDQGTGEAS